MSSKKYAFIHSIYLTKFTEWFLEFFGRGAQSILIVTTLYQGAALLPGITLPQIITNTVFIIQMLTLDIGGMGLAGIARQAAAEGDSEGAKKAGALGKWLIRIVIATLISAALEMIIHPLPVYQLAKSYVDVAFLVVSAVLTIARAICAVQYTVVMHDLKGTHTPAASSTPAVDVEALISQALEKVANDQAQVNQQLLTALDEVKTAQVLPEDEIINTIMGRLSQQFEVFLNERVNVSPVFETGQISASHSLPEPVLKQSANSVSKQRATTVNSVSKQSAKAVSKQQKQPAKNSDVQIARRSKKVSDEEIDAAVHPLLNKDGSLTHRKIASQIGLPETTVYLSLKRWRDRQEVVSSECLETSESAVSNMFETAESEESETAI